MTQQQPKHPAGRPDQLASATARLHVDWTACEGRGLCSELLPELLQADPWGYPTPTGATGPPSQISAAAVETRMAAQVADTTTSHWPRRTGLAVSPAQMGDARHAVHACPRLALHLRGT